MATITSCAHLAADHTAKTRVSWGYVECLLAEEASGSSVEA